jgi:hypothetical protein
LPPGDVLGVGEVAGLLAVAVDGRRSPEVMASMNRLRLPSRESSDLTGIKTFNTETNGLESGSDETPA